MNVNEEFVHAALEAATESSRASGLPVWVTVAQAALESRWGESLLARQAHNYFGIKAHKGHEAIVLPTREFANGAEMREKAAFARYRSMLECFECRDHILMYSAVYAEAREKRGNEEAFVAEMARHWATDPQYAEKLLTLLRQVKGEHA